MNAARRAEIIPLIAPIYARLGRSWAKIALEIQNEAPECTPMAIREWYRNNLGGARDVWDSAAGESDVSVGSALFAEARDKLFEKAAAWLEDGGHIDTMLDASPPKGLRLMRDLAAAFREYGASLEPAKSAPKKEPDNVVSIDQRLEDLKRQQSK